MYDWKIILPVVLSHMAFFVAYLGIPYSIYKLSVVRRTFGINDEAQDVAKKTIHFIVACAITHLVAAVLYFKGVYSIYVIVMVAGAIISIHAYWKWHRLRRMIERAEIKDPVMFKAIEDSLISFQGLDRAMDEALRRQEVIEELNERLTRFGTGLDQFLREIPVILCVATSDYRFTHVSEYWTKITGWTSRELTSSKYFKFIHKDDLNKTKDVADGLSSVPINGFENRWKIKGTDKYIKLNWKAETYTIGGKTYAVATVVKDES